MNGTGNADICDGGRNLERLFGRVRSTRTEAENKTFWLPEPEWSGRVPGGDFRRSVSLMGVMATAVTVVFNFTISRHGQIKYFDQKHERPIALHQGYIFILHVYCVQGLEERYFDFLEWKLFY